MVPRRGSRPPPRSRPDHGPRWPFQKPVRSSHQSRRWSLDSRRRHVRPHSHLPQIHPCPPRLPTNTLSPSIQPTLQQKASPPRPSHPRPPDHYWRRWRWRHLNPRHTCPQHHHHGQKAQGSGRDSDCPEDSGQGCCRCRQDRHQSYRCRYLSVSVSVACPGGESPGSQGREEEVDRSEGYVS